MGFYAYIKKVSIPNPNGDKNRINGTNILTNLPAKCPPSLEGSQAEKWFKSGKLAMKGVTSSSSTNARRSNYYTTTVSAGHAIHTSCHKNARQADRNHPKAPKSEWEGEKNKFKAVMSFIWKVVLFK